MPSNTDPAFSIYKPIPRNCKADAGTPIKQEQQTPVPASQKRKVDDGDAPELRKLKKHKVKDTDDSAQPKLKRTKKMEEEKAAKKAAKEQAKVQEHEAEEENSGVEFKFDIIEKAKEPEEEGNTSDKEEDAVKLAKKAQAKFAKAKMAAQDFGDKDLAEKYYTLESKASKIVQQLCNAQRSGRSVAKNPSNKPPIHPSPAQSKKMIPKKEKETKKAKAEKESKHTAELAEALAAVPEKNYGKFWRMFAEKVQIETKMSALAQRLETLKNDLADLQK